MTTRTRRRTSRRTTSRPRPTSRGTLSAAQRRALPRSAFLDPAGRRFPVPTPSQARRAGISERQRLGILRNALARSAQRQRPGARRVTPTATRAKVRRRAGGAIASVAATTRRRASR